MSTNQGDWVGIIEAAYRPAPDDHAWADGLLEPDARGARDHLAEAVARFEALGRPIELGRCLIDLAEAERRLGEDHHPSLDRARKELESCGALLFLHDLETVEAVG